MTVNRVKLHIQEIVSPNESIITNTTANAWGDFLLISLEDALPDEEFNAIGESLARFMESNPDKHVIVLNGNESKVRFYGFQDESETQEEDSPVYGEPVRWCALDELGPQASL